MMILTGVLVAIILYVMNYRSVALVLVFFFLTNGFHLVPEEAFEIGPLSKGSDYAFFILAGALVIDVSCIKKYLRWDPLIFFLLVFGLMLAACIVYSRYGVGIGWGEIVRSIRYQFFWLAYFVFRNMEKAQLERLLRYLFVIVTVLSALFLLQNFVNREILASSTKGPFHLLGIRLTRYYNQPLMLHFFALLAIYHNPYRGVWRMVSTVILVAALLGAFHRSLVIFFLVALLLGYLIRLPRIRKVQILSAAVVALIVLVSYKGINAKQSRTIRDIVNVTSGNLNDLEDLDMEVLYESTFSFRLAILFEPNLYLWERPITTLLGVGLLTEDSSLARRFNFQIGLRDELTNEIVQTEVGDISHATLTFRMGYLGTGVYLAVLIYLMVFFYRKRENKYAFVSFLYWVLSFGVSFFSSNLLLPTTYLVPLICYALVNKTDSSATAVSEPNV
jgi:hypothetical protein